jgi:hypothetical protein
MCVADIRRRLFGAGKAGRNVVREFSFARFDKRRRARGRGSRSRQEIWNRLMKTTLKFALLVICGVSLVAGEARASVAAKAVNETVEYVTKKFAKETAEEGLEVVTKKIEQFVAKYGDEGVEAVKKLGPNAMKVAAEAGEHSATAIKAMARFGDDGIVWIAQRPEGLKLAAKYGDDAAEALVKHKGIAEKLVENGGEAAARALKAVDPQNARLLARMADDPASAALTYNPKLLDVVGKYGDNAVQYIWRNKGKLSVAAVLATFVANPKPYIDGLSDLSQAAVAPVSDAVASGVRSSWSFMIWLVVLAGTAVAGWQLYLRYKIRLAQQQLQTGPIARK